MAMMTADLDDSGTHQQSEVAVAACFVSDVRRWAKFETEWRSVLDDSDIAGCGFHMADFVAHQRPFDSWEQDKRDRTIKSLIGIIKEYALTGMATAVVKRDYDRFVVGKLRDKLGHYHYTFAVQGCLAEIERRRAKEWDTQAYAYVFDWMTKGKHEIDNLFDSILAHNLGAHLGVEPDGWTYGNRKQQVQLQAADMLAWEANKYIRDHQNTGLTPRRSFKSMVDGIEIKTRFFYGEYLQDFVEDVTPKYEAVNWDGPLGGFLP
jgi:hypothetical protein